MDYTNAIADMCEAINLANQMDGRIRWEADGFAVSCKGHGLHFHFRFEGWVRESPRALCHWSASIEHRSGLGENPKDALANLVDVLRASEKHTAKLAAGAEAAAAAFDAARSE